MFPLLIGIAAGALTAFSTFSSSMRQGAAQRQQAAQLQANAAIQRRNAQIELERSRQEAYGQDRQKSRLRREFMQRQAHNRVALASGNVDMASGSALDVALGNIDAFAADMGDNAFAVAMKKWEGREKFKNLHAQANAMDANASYLNKTADTIGSSLLTAGLTGLGGFASGYTLAGGSLSKLLNFSSSPATIAEGAWDEKTATGLLMRHPAGANKIAFVGIK